MTRSETSVLPEGYSLTPPPGQQRPPRPRRRRNRARRRRILLAIVTAVLLLSIFPAWSVVGAWTTPGNESFNAKWADWLRSHDAAFLANALENYYYTHNEPAKGGRPKGLNPLPVASGSVSPTTTPSSGTSQPWPYLAKPAPIGLVVSPALAGEGQWQPVGPPVDGQAAMYEAQFRADTVYTSEITSAVWIDPLRLSLSLVPGQSEPGGTWPEPPYITPAELPSTVAAFNGGFRFQDAHGGLYLDGRTAVPLVNGAASLVIYSNGHVDVGAWGSEVSMTPQVVAVLQNLVPMVDNGLVSPAASYSDHQIWGNTLGGQVVVARSGIGVTKDGALLYVAGPALTSKTLAEALQRAGAVRAMTLDINPEWVTFNFYSHPNPADPSEVVPTKLYTAMQRSAYRYLGPTAESRDFIRIALPTA